MADCKLYYLLLLLLLLLSPVAHNSAFSAVPKSFRSVASSGHAPDSATSTLPLFLSLSLSLSLLHAACSFSFCTRHFVICSDCGGRCCVDCAFVKFRIPCCPLPPLTLCNCCYCHCCGHLKYSYAILIVFKVYFQLIEIISFPDFALSSIVFFFPAVGATVRTHIMVALTARLSR